MGQFAIPLGAYSVQTSEPREAGAAPPEPSASGSVPTSAPDSETRRVLGALRLVLDRLPE